MFKNYFKTAIRNIKRHKAYSFINISGFAISMAMFILILLFVLHELSIDKFQNNFDRIYKVSTWNKLSNRYSTDSHPPLAELLANMYPEIEKTVRLHYWSGFSQYYQYNGQGYKMENIIFSDPSIFNIFTFDVVQGDLSSASTNPLSLVLTESQAKRIFGDKNPLGKIIQRNKTTDFTITAIIKDAPSSSILQYNGFASISSLTSWRGQNYLSSWDDPHCETYLLLKPGIDKNTFQSKMNENYKKYSRENDGTAIENYNKLIALKDLYFSEYYIANNAKRGNLQQVYSYSIIGFLILIIAIINFVNISTARASLRMKEVGIRKVVGSHKFSLIFQFLCETILLCLFATFCALLLVEFMLPTFNNLIETKLSLEYYINSSSLIFFTLCILFIGIIAGIYPAFYLTTFKPVVVLKGSYANETKSGVLRKGLIIFQFIASIFLIICTIVIARQIHFMKNTDLGFKSNQIIWVRLNKDIGEKYEVFYNNLIKYPGIQELSLSNTVPGKVFGGWYCEVNGKSTDVRTFAVDPDYIQLMGLEVLKGRNFSWERQTDMKDALIFNETAIKKLELDSPIGKQIGPNRGTIIGVVKDFHFQSLHREIKPLVLIYKQNWFSHVNIKVTAVNLHETIQFIQSTYDKLSPDFPFEYQFLDESFDRLYKSDEKFREIFIGFSIFAIFIACLGLFGLIAFMAECRIKEIGIRKVLGASTSKIVILLTKDFTKLVLAANFIGWPIAWFAMNKWLQNFAYRINIKWWIFGLTAIVVLVIALMTVIFQAIKAALTNPIATLKYE